MNRTPLIVHTDWSRAWGGQEIRTLTELREMKKLGFRVGMIVREDSELARRGLQEEIPVYFIDFSSKFKLSAWRDLFQLIRKLKPAVVNTHSSEDSWMAGCVARLCRVPLTIKTRHVLAPISSSFSYNIFFDIIFACSESIAAQLVKQRVASKKIIVQPTGVDEERFVFSLRDRQEIRRRYGIGKNEMLVGNVSFLRAYKGHDFIINTASTLPENFKFIFVGGGDDQPKLEEKIERAGLAQRFFLTGHREDPERFFSAIDIIFFASYEGEGVSQSFVQGLLYGIPLLTTRTPSLLEPLEFVHNYRDINYGDVEAGRSGLLELAGIPRDEEKIGFQRQAIAAKYGLKRMVENILRIYGEHGISI